MSHAFFEPLSSDMQHSILEHLSSKELFHTCCFAVSKILRANALECCAAYPMEAVVLQKKYGS